MTREPTISRNNQTKVHQSTNKNLVYSRISTDVPFFVLEIHHTHSP